MTMMAAALFGLLALFLFVRFFWAWLTRKPRARSLPDHGP
jgi:hypothetical protein